MSAHTCHAYNCTRPIAPKLLMCPAHWRKVPRKIQALVWKHYRPGQEIDKNPTEAYVLVQRSAVWAVFVAEGGCLITKVPEIGSLHFMVVPAVMTRLRQERVVIT